MDNCQSLTEIAGDIWTKYHSLDPVSVDVVSVMIKFFNEIAKSKYNFGPRSLPFDSLQSGTIESMGDRKFVATQPTKEASKLTITKVDGNDHVTVHVCTFDSTRNHRELKTFEITKDTPNGHLFEVSNIPANQIVTVLFDGHSLPYSLSYHLRLTKA